MEVWRFRAEVRDGSQREPHDAGFHYRVLMRSISYSSNISMKPRCRTRGTILLASSLLIARSNTATHVESGRNRELYMKPSADAMSWYARKERARPAAWFPSCTIAGGAPIRTAPSLRRSTNARSSAESISTISLPSTSERGSLRLLRRVSRFRTRCSHAEHCTLVEAYSTEYRSCGSLKRLGAGAAPSGLSLCFPRMTR